MKKIGFCRLSLDTFTAVRHASAADTLLQSIDLAVAAEELGADGAYFRVHHFARQLSSRSSAGRNRRQNENHEIGTGD
jgi:alkanesulfonate monooxygenase SsuD/methylene tetrahydromethanopterin reductase-like flavin-dependent oxidoreductase (luciferase family)